MRLVYAANARIPSEKAHPYQIVQMCEAFAGAGADVLLLYAARRNLPELATRDIWGHYGVAETFDALRVPVLDLYPEAARLPGRAARYADRAATALEMASYHFMLTPFLLGKRGAVLYTRNALTLAAALRLWPGRARRMFFEAHTAPATTAGEKLRRGFVGRIGGVITITEHLRQRYGALGTPPERLLVAHDGFRAARFDIEGKRADWRAYFGWPQDAYVVGYMGRFQTLGMDKGMGDLADAVAALAADAGARPVRLGLVGGPAETVDGLRGEFAARGLPPGTILYAGQLPPADVPGALRAFDVCTMPFPWTAHFAYYASPMKLFEYMASGTPLVASDLPATAEIVRDGQNGLLTPPGDPAALAGALRRLRDDPSLGARLAAQALADVQGYTWAARARHILAFIERAAG